MQLIQSRDKAVKSSATKRVTVSAVSAVCTVLYSAMASKAQIMRFDGLSSPQCRQTSGFSCLALVFNCNFISCCHLFSFSALGTQLWMREVSSHHSISAACESSVNAHITVTFFSWFHLFFKNCNISFFVCQDPCVHMEQVKPAEKRSSELSDAAGAGIRPYSTGPGRATPGSPGQASLWSHSNCQAVYGGPGPRQHSNRRPNEPPTSLENKGHEKTEEQEEPGLYFPSLDRRKWISPGVREGDAEWANGSTGWHKDFLLPPPCPLLVCHSDKTGKRESLDSKWRHLQLYKLFSQDCCTL